MFGHFTQTGTGIDPSLTVLGYVQELAERVPQPGGGSLGAEQFLEKFLFPRSMHGIRLERLSGGEVRRLTLVRLLATAPNFLLLDEPTNDLDLDTIRLLEEYLADFPGCILLVSHDRAFLDRLTDRLFLFDGRGASAGSRGTTKTTARRCGRSRPPPLPSGRPRPPGRDGRRRVSPSTSAGSTSFCSRRSTASRRSRRTWKKDSSAR